MENDVEKSRNDHDRLIILESKIVELERRIHHSVSRDSFLPVKTIVYGAVGLICMAVLGALVTVVMAQ